MISEKTDDKKMNNLDYLKKHILFYVIVFSACTKTTAQEGSFGGNGAGFTVSCVTQSYSTTNNFYFGGNDDGYAISCYNQLDPSLDSIYFGGSDDGFSMSCYDQPDPTIDSIYEGGVDDGFSISCYTQTNSPTNNFYYGGIDDGYAISCYVQPDASADNIFSGGVDDGFAVTCYAQAHSQTKGMYSGTGISAGFAFSCVGSLNNEVPLPIELLSFDAVLNENQVDLLWSTTSEINNNYFIVEKTIDNVGFEEVVIVNGAGNSNAFISYTAVDKNPSIGMSYYRLKQVDFNGNYSYSNLVPIRYAKNMQIKIYPNPVEENLFYISLNGKNEQDLQIELYTSLGKLVYFTSFVQQKGLMLKEVSIPQDLATGVYFVVIQGENEIFKQKLVVK